MFELSQGSRIYRLKNVMQKLIGINTIAMVITSPLGGDSYESSYDLYQSRL